MLRPYQDLNRLAQFSLVSFRERSLGETNTEPRILNAAGQLNDSRMRSLDDLDQRL